MYGKGSAEDLDPSTLDGPNELCSRLTPNDPGCHVLGGRVQHSDDGNRATSNLKPNGIGEKAIVEPQRSPQCRLGGLWRGSQSRTGWAVVAIHRIDHCLGGILLREDLLEVDVGRVVQVAVETSDHLGSLGRPGVLNLSEDTRVGVPWLHLLVHGRVVQSVALQDVRAKEFLHARQRERFTSFCLLAHQERRLRSVEVVLEEMAYSQAHGLLVCRCRSSSRPETRGSSDNRQVIVVPGAAIHTEGLTQFGRRYL